MRFVTSRAALARDVKYTTMILVHHAQNAARAKTHANMGNREAARWYGEQARQDLASYLKLYGKLGAIE